MNYIDRSIVKIDYIKQDGKKIIIKSEKDYTIEEVIHSNTDTKTEVILAYDNKLKRDIIIKKIGFENAEDKNKIISEVTSLISLKQNQRCEVPMVYDCFSDKENIYILMEYIKGETLRKIIDNNLKSEKNEGWYRRSYNLFKGVVSSVKEIHKKDRYVHKDLKPENVIISNGKTYIIDFGISGPANNNRGVGTAGYKAPEQDIKEKKYQVCQASDVFSLAEIALEIFTGITCEYGTDLIYSRTDESIENIDFSDMFGQYKFLEDIICKSLSYNPRKRYRNAIELYGQIEREEKNARNKKNHKW